MRHPFLLLFSPSPSPSPDSRLPKPRRLEPKSLSLSFFPVCLFHRLLLPQHPSNFLLPSPPSTSTSNGTHSLLSPPLLPIHYPTNPPPYINIFNSLDGGTPSPSPFTLPSPSPHPHPANVLEETDGDDDDDGGLPHFPHNQTARPPPSTPMTSLPLPAADLGRMPLNEGTVLVGTVHG